MMVLHLTLWTRQASGWLFGSVHKCGEIVSDYITPVSSKARFSPELESKPITEAVSKPTPFQMRAAPLQEEIVVDDVQDEIDLLPEEAAVELASVQKLKTSQREKLGTFLASQACIHVCDSHFGRWRSSRLNMIIWFRKQCWKRTRQPRPGIQGKHWLSQQKSKRAQMLHFHLDRIVSKYFVPAPPSKLLKAPKHVLYTRGSRESRGRKFQGRIAFYGLQNRIIYMLFSEMNNIWVLINQSDLCEVTTFHAQEAEDWVLPSWSSCQVLTQGLLNCKSGKRFMTLSSFREPTTELMWMNAFSFGFLPMNEVQKPQNDPRELLFGAGQRRCSRSLVRGGGRLVWQLLELPVGVSSQWVAALQKSSKKPDKVRAMSLIFFPAETLPIVVLGTLRLKRLLSQDDEATLKLRYFGETFTLRSFPAGNTCWIVELGAWRGFGEETPKEGAGGFGNIWMGFFVVDSNTVYIPWAPETMKNKGFGHLKNQVIYQKNL